MRGTGSSGGAVTVVNALPTGDGAAIGTGLGATAEVLVNRGDGACTRLGGGDATLVQAAFEAVGRHVGQLIHGEARTTGPPEARGLKSSHAVAIALVNALADALGAEIEPRDALRIAVEACFAAGVTRTGAWDDGGACLGGGLVVARAGRIVHHAAGPALEVAVLVPDRTRLTSQTPTLKELSLLNQRCTDLTLDGRWEEALTGNGLAWAACLQEPVAPILDALRAGARAAGLTGTGPAIAALAQPQHAAAVAEALGAHGPVIRTRTRTKEVDLCSD